MIDIESLPVSFSKKLQIERVKHNFSQEKLAELSGLHRTTISAIERCKLSPSIDTVAKIANAFDLTFAEIFDLNF